MRGTEKKCGVGLSSVPFLCCKRPTRTISPVRLSIGQLRLPRPHDVEESSGFDPRRCTGERPFVLCARAQIPMSLRVDLRCSESVRPRAHTNTTHAPGDILRDAALLMVKHQARDAVQVQQQIQHSCVVFGECVQGLGELALRQRSKRSANYERMPTGWHTSALRDVDSGASHAACSPLPALLLEGRFSDAGGGRLRRASHPTQPSARRPDKNRQPPPEGRTCNHPPTYTRSDAHIFRAQGGGRGQAPCII